MKSKVSLKGHPVHPMLVAFPIAFFTGTFIMDLVALMSGNVVYRQTAFYLEAGGIIFSVFAALPGIVDFFLTVPPKSSGRKRALKHGLLNISMLLVFTAAFVLRLDDGISLLYLLGLETAGMTLLVIAGWLGGTLVYRNQIGVDHRYAGAGRWKEEKLDASAGQIELHHVDDLQPGQMRLLHIGGKRIVLGRTEKGYVVFEDRCTHRGGSLADGALVCDTVQCPWHGSQFDVGTGSVKAGPASESIKTYKIIRTDRKVFLQL